MAYNIDEGAGDILFEVHGDNYEDEQFAKRMQYEQNKRNRKRKFKNGI